LIPGIAPQETEKAMNYYLASQLTADRQAAVAADLTHRAQVRDARAARKASTASTASAAAVRPARNRRLVVGRLFLGRLAHAGA
jgi:hypothetical protein